jgi:hypothetical protein
MSTHPTESWFEGMDRSQLLAWAAAHASWSEGVWARGDAPTWSSAFADDVIAHIRRRMGPESYRGVAELVEKAWVLHEFFPHEAVAVVDVRPPAVILYRIEMRDELGNVVGIYIAHRLDGAGRVAELVVHDDDAPLAEVQAEMARLADRRHS